jgi:hypothetical protein
LDWRKGSHANVGLYISVLGVSVRVLWLEVQDQTEPTLQHFPVLHLEVAFLILLLEFFVSLKLANATNWSVSSSQIPFSHALAVESKHQLNPQQLHHAVLPRLPYRFSGNPRQHDIHDDA